MSGRIFCIMGKSCSGKDTLYRHLMRDETLALSRVISYTTRPIRVNEENGKQYYFTDEKHFKALADAGKVIESRAYDTWYGIWYYFTADDGQIDLAEHDYLLIGTPESFVALKKYFGEDRVIPIYIELDDGVRLERALRREKKQETPKYEEMCRRFLTDAEDFSEEKLQAAGIDVRFENRQDELEETLRQVREYILARKG